MLIWIYFSFLQANSFPLIPKEYQLIDTQDQLIQSCFNFTQTYLPQFLLDFHPEYSIRLQKSWMMKDENGAYIILQLIRNLLSYQTTIHIPNLSKSHKKYIVSIKAIEGETERHSHWIQPSNEILNVAMKAVQDKFGDDVLLKNVVLYKVIKIGRVIGQLVIDVENDLERMLININLIRPSHQNEYFVEFANRIY